MRQHFTYNQKLLTDRRVSSQCPPEIDMRPPIVKTNWIQIIS